MRFPRTATSRIFISSFRVGGAFSSVGRPLYEPLLCELSLLLCVRFALGTRECCGQECDRCCTHSLAAAEIPRHKLYGLRDQQQCEHGNAGRRTMSNADAPCRIERAVSSRTSYLCTHATFHLNAHAQQIAQNTQLLTWCGVGKCKVFACFHVHNPDDGQSKMIDQS